MKVIIVGAGQVGYHIAERLSNEGHSVTIIEKNREKEQLLRSKLNAMVIRGSGASGETLDQAGIKTADLFISVTDQDEVNLVACMLAHEREVKKIVARVKSLGFTTADWAKNARKLGVDLLINPQNVVAEEISRVISYTAANVVAEFAGGQVVFLGYVIGRGSPMAGISLKDLAGVRGLYRMVVPAIARGHVTLIPRGDDEFQEGDILYFVCHKRDLPAINYLFELERQPTKTVFILGGGRIGEALARKLVAMDFRVKLIESDPQRCERIAEDLDKVAVLHTVGTDVGTLKHEGIADCDVYVAVTGNEQTNILCSLLAKNCGAKRAIALVNHHEFVTLAPSLGVDACVSSRLATATAILKFVRPTSVTSIAVIEHSNAEVLEIVLPAKSSVLGKPLKELNLSQGAVIAVIVRGEHVIIPGGEDHLEAGDHVIVFTLPEAITKVESFFS